VFDAYIFVAIISVELLLCIIVVIVTIIFLLLFYYYYLLLMKLSLFLHVLLVPLILDLQQHYSITILSATSSRSEGSPSSTPNASDKSSASSGGNELFSYYIFNLLHLFRAFFMSC
jgi:hypothetical protein